jgi:hypothetical protein
MRARARRHSYDLFGAGLELHSFKPSRDTSSKDALDDAASSATTNTTATATTKPELLVKVDADHKGQHPADSEPNLISMIKGILCILPNCSRWHC